MVDQETLAAAIAYFKSHGGGPGGTNDYEELENLPQINGNEIIGNKTSAELGITSITTSGHALVIF